MLSKISMGRTGQSDGALCFACDDDWGCSSESAKSLNRFRRALLLALPPIPVSIDDDDDLEAKMSSA